MRTVLSSEQQVLDLIPSTEKKPKQTPTDVPSESIASYTVQSLKNTIPRRNERTSVEESVLPDPTLTESARADGEGKEEMTWEETGEHAGRSEDVLTKSSKTPEKAEI